MKIVSFLAVAAALTIYTDLSAQTKPAAPATPAAPAAKPGVPPPAAKNNKQELVQRANDLMEANRFEEAILMLNDAVKSDPNDAELCYKQGICLVGMANFREAVTPLTKATTIKKNYVEAYQELGHVYYELRNVKGAVGAYDMAFKYDEDVAQKLTYKLQILDILFSLNKYGLAKAHLYDAKSLPDGLGESFDVKFKEAQYLNLSGKYEEALKILQVIIDDEVQAVEGNEQYFYEMGVSLHMLGKYKEADAEFTKAKNGEYILKIRRYSPETYYEIATTYYNILDYETSEKYLNIVKAISPGFVDVNKLSLNLAAIKADNKATIKATEEEIKKQKDQIQLAKMQEDLAFLFFKASNYQAAEMSADACLKIREFDMKVTFMKAMCEYKLKQPAQAQDLLLRASKNPRLSQEEKARLSFVLGLLYRSGDNQADAAKQFRNASVGPFKSASLVQIEEINRIRQGLGQEEDLGAEDATEAGNE
jgi:tetratricopeptide (TPR) repeat protein